MASRKKKAAPRARASVATPGPDATVEQQQTNPLQTVRNAGITFAGQVQQMDVAMDEALVNVCAMHLTQLLADNRRRGKTQWWNPTLCAQIDIQRLASQAIVEKRWEDVVALGCMMLVKSA